MTTENMSYNEAINFLNTVRKTQLFKNTECICIRTEYEHGFDIEYDDASTYTEQSAQTVLFLIVKLLANAKSVSIYVAHDETLIYIDNR